MKALAADSPGTGGVSFTNEPQKNVTGTSDVVASNLRFLQFDLHNAGVTHDAGNISIEKCQAAAREVQARGLTISAVSGSLPAGQSNPFSITTTASTLLEVVSPYPGTVAAGSPFSLTFQAVTSNGTVDTGFNDPVTLSLASNPGAATLGGGPLTVAAVNGKVTFTGLTLNKLGTGYTLHATSGSLTDATSSGFNISAATLSQLIFTSQPVAPDPGVMNSTASQSSSSGWLGASP